MAALLYAVLDLVENGKNRSCTSNPQQWGKRKKPHESDFLCNINLKSLKKDCSEEVVAPKKRRDYDPRSPSQRTVSRLADFDLDKLHQVTGGNASILMCRPRVSQMTADVPTDLDVMHTETVVSDTVPSTIEGIATSIDKTQLTESQFVNEFHTRLNVSETEAKNVEKLTRNQAESELWHYHRNGRVTGSKLREYTSKVHDGEIAGRTTSSAKTALGYYKQFRTKDTQWGLDHEDSTCRLVFKKLGRTHKSMTMRKCGVYISCHYPYMCATPDRIIECKCCGQRTLEVKHPRKAKGKSISDYLKCKGTCLREVNGVVSLKENHDYYYQVQAQMLVTGLRASVFCLNTCHVDGLFIQEILYDEQLINDVLQKSKIFFDRVILSEIYSRTIKHQMEDDCKLANVLQEKADANPVVECVIADDSAVASTSGCHGDVGFALDVSHTVDVCTSSHLCGICKTECLEFPVKKNDICVMCQMCNSKYHARCTGVQGRESCINDENYIWLCHKCIEV